jgi:uncharacterized protein
MDNTAKAPKPLPDLLPLFPLQVVLFPDSVLGLKIFEARYLDMVSECLRSQQPFGLICLIQGHEAGPSPSVTVEEVGVLTHIDEVDSEQPGILRLKCHGGQRFRRRGAMAQRGNGLWVSAIELIADDPLRLPGPATFDTVRALQSAIGTLQEHGQLPFAPPFRLDEAGWVANRWCELLPVPLAAKQKLMALEDPVIRLSLVDGFLRDKKVVIGEG